MYSYNVLAYFIDKNDCLQKANIKIYEDHSIEINTFDQAENNTGYARVFFYQNNKIVLDTIYCFDKFRGCGIASSISELIDYLLNDYDGYVIRGCYKPCQLADDRINKIERDQEELDLRARNFYNSNGYEIVNHEDFINNKDKYPYLTEEDFDICEGISDTIVAKPIISKNHSFFKQDGVIYCDDSNKKNKKLYSYENSENSKYVKVMVGTGENAKFTYKRRGEKYMLDDGTIVRAGDTAKDKKRRIDDKIDDMVYSKPVAFIKKLNRRFKNR